jgi:thiol-disulfide isomerase/thioredoxin
MKGKRVAFLLVGLLTGAAIGLVVLFRRPHSTAGAQRRPPVVSAAASDFTLTSVESQQVTLSDLKGQGVLVNFWATWCPPCLDEMPLLEQYSQKYPGSLVVLGINYQEQDELVEKFRQENSISFPLLLDPSGKVADLYYVHNFPMSFFIDSEGTIRAQHLGVLTEDQLVRYLKLIGIE